MPLPSFLEVERLTAGYGGPPVLRRHIAGGERGRVRRPSRLVGLRQDDAASLDRRLRGAGVRRDPRRRPGYHAAAARPPRHGDGLPVLRALAAYDRAREHRLRPQGPARRCAEGCRQGRRDARDARACRISARARSPPFPAASASAWRSAVRSPSIPASCFSTSRSPTSTRASARASGTRSALCSRGSAITAIHVTHDREEAMVMADRIVILNGGRIEQQGEPEQSTTGRKARSWRASWARRT